MVMVNFRVDDDTKKRMDRLKHLNWSELLRAHVSEVIKGEERRLAVKRDPALIEESMREIEDLRGRSPEGWSGAEVVIQWRRAGR